MAACILVLAGADGAGKSSLCGAALDEAGVPWHNAERCARELRVANPALAPEEASSEAWELGRQALERALDEGGSFIFETSLGTPALAAALAAGARGGAEIHLWFAGLATPELYIERVRARGARGGVDVAEARIRERCAASLQHLIELMPRLSSLVVFDNSQESDPRRGMAPRPRLVLRMRGHQVTEMIAPAEVPGWAKPVVMQALRLMKRR